MPRSRTVLEAGAWLLGLLCAAVPLYSRVEARSAQQFASRNFASRTTNSSSGVPVSSPATDTSEQISASGILGRLEISSLGLSVPVLDDYDPDSLRKGVGHIRGTALPGGLGNFAVAGHRDTFFRPLRSIRPGTQITMTTAQGTYQYIVDTTSIVLPSNVSVLDIGWRPEMTLITCYPFNFIGAAPKRFIVRAHLLSLDPT